MEKCPQCDTDRQQDEQGQYLGFCDDCGHKFTTTPKPQSQPESQSQSEPESLEEYEKDYVARVIPDEGETDAGGDDSGDAGGVESSGGAIWIPGQDNAGEQPIYFEDNPKTVGRADVSELLKSRGNDPLQVSRKQFTISKESDTYYIEDGKTSVQDNPSGNHTTVNGKDITGKGKVELNDGDTIGLATVLDVTFRMS
jgi:hypothetical protein